MRHPTIKCRTSLSRTFGRVDASGAAKGRVATMSSMVISCISLRVRRVMKLRHLHPELTV